MGKNVIVACLLMVAAPLLGRAQDQAKLLAGHGAGREYFGNAVALDGDRAVVGAPNDNAGGHNDAGAAYVYRWDGAAWVEEARLTAAVGVAKEHFGAAVTLRGTRLLVGAPGDPSSEVLGYAGAAYVYEWDGAVWTQTARLTASDGQAGDQFGSAVALDGDRAAVAAPYDDDRGGSAGAVYVFTRTGTTWAQTVKLTAPDGATDDRFGSALALRGDHLVVASPGAGFGVGAVYTLRWNATAWVAGQQFIGLSNAGSRFGNDVSMDGNRFVVDSGVGNQVDVFEWNGSAWAKTAEVILAAQFIGPIALAADRLVVAARQEGVAGAVYVIQRSTGAWRQEARLVSSDAAPLDGFGEAVAVSGSRVLVGTPFDDDQGDDSGSVYVFSLLEGRWGERAKLTASDAAADGGFGLDDAFGADVALSGTHALIGTASGAAYAFEWNGVDWTQAARLTATPENAYFGLDVALDGDRALVGTNLHEEDVYVFEWDGAAWVEAARIRPDVSLSGFSSALALDGDRTLVSTAFTGFVFERSGAAWGEAARLMRAENFTFRGEPGSVALDGDRAALWAQRFVQVQGHPGGGFFENVVFVFAREGTQWVEQARLKPIDGGEDDDFGRALALDGARLLVGTPGRAYIFEWDGAQWRELARLSPPVPLEHLLGIVSVALEGRWAVVGWPHSSRTFAGEVSLFYRRDDASWRLVKTLTAPGVAVNDWLGWRVALDGDRLLTGAIGDDDNGAGTGAAYVFSGLDLLVSSAREEEPALLPAPFVLHQNYPNPFEATTTIAYTLEKPAFVRLEVMDVLGRRVALLADAVAPAGRHEAVYDGQHLAAGLYFYRLQAGAQHTARPLVLRR